MQLIESLPKSAPLTNGKRTEFLLTNLAQINDKPTKSPPKTLVLMNGKAAKFPLTSPVSMNN